MRFFAAIVIILCLPVAALANRVALVIGNSDYTTVSPLDNPQNDSAAISQALRSQGFEVVNGDNLGRAEMRDTLRQFRSLADGAEIALVYYAGHGIEIAGTNYLVPVDARLEDERDAGLEMVEVDLVLRQISGARTLKMVVLDACRNNPFVARMKRQGSSRSVGQGLGDIRSGEADTLIAYAAAAGEITPDGRVGENSPFTSAFLAALSGPPVDVRRMLGQVRDRMRVSVPGAAPFVYSSLGGGEYVINPRATGPTPAPTAREGSISVDFVRIDKDGDLADWDDFLIRYEGQSDHPLYAFALEKRSALKAAPPAQDADAVEGDRSGNQDPPESLQSSQSVQSPTGLVIAAKPPAMADTADSAARSIQEVLKAQSCYFGSIDGILGRNSARGLAEFARQAGIPIGLSSSPDVAELQATIGILRAYPDVQCPRVARRTNSGTAKPAPAATKQDIAAPDAQEPKGKIPVLSNKPCPLQEELKFNRPECH